jgi:hypothetical protein
LRGAMLSFASQIVFYHEDTQRKKAAQSNYLPFCTGEALSQVEKKYWCLDCCIYFFFVL